MTLSLSSPRTGRSRAPLAAGLALALLSPLAWAQTAPVTPMTPDITLVTRRSARRPITCAGWKWCRCATG